MSLRTECRVSYSSPHICLWSLPHLFLPSHDLFIRNTEPPDSIAQPETQPTKLLILKTKHNVPKPKARPKTQFAYTKPNTNYIQTQTLSFNPYNLTTYSIQPNNIPNNPNSHYIIRPSPITQTSPTQTELIKPSPITCKMSPIYWSNTYQLYKHPKPHSFNQTQSNNINNANPN